MNRKSKIFRKNITSIFFYKLIALLFVYLTVPVLIRALGVEMYGVWVTIYSLFGWIYFLDFGITNGLKNKLTIAFLKKGDEANEYMSTAYLCLVLIALGFFIVGSILIYSFDISKLLNINLEEWYVKTLLFITLITFVFIFVLSIYKQFYYAKQKSALVELSGMLFTGLVFFILYLFLYKFQSSLITTTLIYGISNIVICLIFTYYFFRSEKKYSIKLKHFRKNKVNELRNISGYFFIIQVCVLVILATDNILVIKLLGPTEVTSYNNVYKLFQFFLMISTLIHAPLWPLYTDAFHNKDILWIKKTIRKLNYLFIILLFAVAITVYMAPQILAFWIKEDIFYDNKLLLFMGIFVLVRIYGEIYITFLNGIGKIRTQLIISVIAAVINIPLSIYFVKYLNLGNSGVILATVISMSLYLMVMPFQATRILNKSLSKTTK